MRSRKVFCLWRKKIDKEKREHIWRKKKFGLRKRRKIFCCKGEKKNEELKAKKSARICNSHLPLQFFHCPKGWKALLISIAVVYVSENIVVQHRRHQTPSSERQVEVAKALELLPVHSSVRVRVSGVHQRL